jgi:hypothetical protein
MLGIFFIYFIGKQFYELAQDYDRNKWGHAFLGIFMYYLGTFVGAIGIAFVCLFLDIDFDGLNDTLLSILSIPFGMLVSWLTYCFLKKKFIHDTSDINILYDNILDEGL